MFSHRDWLLNSPILIVSVVLGTQSWKVLRHIKSRSQRRRSGWTTSAHVLRVFRTSRPLSENCVRAVDSDLEAFSLLAALGLWLLLRPQHITVPNEIAVLDLRNYSSERGEPTSSNQRPLDILRATKHPTLYLPAGSKEGNYDLALLGATGDEVLRATGTARLEDHVVVLRAEVDLARVGSASYFLGIRQAGLEWTRFPSRVF